jgi:GNAT superfamily N-acetyltransferase
MNAFEFALQFQRRTTELIADEIRPIEAGFVARSPSLPEVWSANHVRVSRPVGFEELTALADEHLAGLPYRQVALEDDQSGRRLAAPLRAAGWRLEREVVMELVRPADRDVNTGMVIEAGEDEMLALMERWHREGLPETSEDGLRQLAAYGRRENRAWGDRTFAIVGDDGRPAAMTKLRANERVAQLEDVFTAPEARGRGYGRALVTHAAEQARRGGHDLIFIVADDNDWPKLLYAKVGFEPIGWTWSFHRGPGGPGTHGPGPG